MRDIDELIGSANDVLQRAFVLSGTWNIEPLFSGGHDSLVACHIASQHPRFAGRVHHIDTGIGAAYTRRFVESVCDRFGWKLVVHKSKDTYEQFVRDRGFPGPAMHQFAYNRLKDRCVYKITKTRRSKSILITGCRSQESVRRMGHVQPIKVGDNGKNMKRVWAAVCHDWSKAEQAAYMDEFGLPVNKLKVAVGLSGECFCGSFAKPGELELVREHAPDVAKEIDRLAGIARQCGKHDQWGTKPNGQIVVSTTGPMCSSCDQRAASCGIVVIENP